MSKIVTSNIKRFQGTVTLRDPMTFDMLARWQEAQSNIAYANAALKEKHGITSENHSMPAYVSEQFMMIARVMYPLILEMVEKWELTNILPGVTVANFPNASPRTGAASIHALVGWLITECQNIYIGSEDEDPNE